MSQIIICVLFIAIAQSDKPAPSISDLFASLEQPAEREQASTELLHRGQASESERNEVSRALAAKVSHLDNRDLWRAEVKLAGELKLVSLAPLIALSLDQDTRFFPGGIHTMNRAISPDYDPAVKALISFGPAAIPAIEAELDKGDRAARFRCVNALSFIPGPEAIQALKEQLTKEQDPALKSRIELHLNNPRESPTGPLRIMK